LIELENAVVFHGSNLDVLPTLPDNSVDAIVTDPPYELGFMGKSWDSSGIAYSVELWQECLRVLKPGGHLLAFGGSRTWHRIAVAIEDAGFDVRDSIAWLYGSGFPKSHNVANAIDKLMGASNRGHAISSGNKYHPTTGEPRANGEVLPKYESRTAESEGWAGWGTALKPAFEPIVVARKPLVGTVAANVLQWGVGGLNIDGSRIGTDSISINNYGAGFDPKGNLNGLSQVGQEYETKTSQGRWPANIILDEYTAGLLDEQSGATKSSTGSTHPNTSNGYHGNLYGQPEKVHGFGDSGGASRFFYVAKASKKDRNEGLEDLPEIANSEWPQSLDGDDKRGAAPRQNFHPTVKPTALMEYLVKLVTPPGGTVLDPFTGSGSTGKAALLNGFKFIGIELTADYMPIIEGRLKHAAETYANQAKEEETKEQETLF